MRRPSVLVLPKPIVEKVIVLTTPESGRRYSLGSYQSRTVRCCRGSRGDGSGKRYQHDDSRIASMKRAVRRGRVCRLGGRGRRIVAWGQARAVAGQSGTRAGR